MNQWPKFLALLIAAALLLGLGAACAASAEHATASLTVTIAVDGTPPTPADACGIQLQAVDAGAPLPEGGAEGLWVSPTVDNTGTIPIVIEYDNVGVYRYTVTQVHPDNPTMVYQTSEYELRVTVYRENNVLKVAQFFHLGDKKSGTITYTNRRKTGALTVSKQVQVPSGHFIFAGKQFRMTLELSEPATIPAGYQWPAGVTTQDHQHFTFQLAHDQKVKLEYLPVGAAYTVTEAPEAGYNPRQEGEPIVLTGVIAEDSSAAASFINEYATSPSQITLRAEKTLTGRAWHEGETFSFTLTAEDGAPISGGTATVTQNGGFAFGTITYTQADMIGATETGDGRYEKAFHYTITEDLPAGVTADQPVKDGIIYDTHPVRVTVTVTDDGKGNLTAAAEYEGATTFTNVYRAAETVTLEGEKLLTGRAFKPGDRWTFTLKAESSDAPMPKEAAVTITPSEGGSCSFEIGPIEFTEATLGTYRYALTESGTVTAVTNAVRAEIAITVTDNGDGTLTAETVYTNHGSDRKDLASFTNMYASQGKGAPAALKVLTGRTLAAGQFSFELLDAEGRVLETVQNQADGTVSFAQISYTQADVPSSPIRYAVREVIPAEPAPGYTYDTHTIDVEMTLTDDLEGHITAVASPSGAEAVFNNVYKATGRTVDKDGKSTINAGKELIGAELTAGQFAFELRTADGQLVERVTNAANGEIVFTPLEYTQDDVPNSPFVYKIREVAGSDSMIVYDSHTLTVTVTVTDNGDGTLTATPVYSGGRAFVNTFEAMGFGQVHINIGDCLE